MEDYIRTKLATALMSHQHGGLRFIDLTAYTEDAGNTELAIALIPFEGEDGDPSHLESILEPLFDSAGDHHEEVTVKTMNNEYIILFNFNK